MTSLLQSNLLPALHEEKARLLHHPLYRTVTSRAGLALFMEQHIICVWDFMTLVKSLQADICGTQLPWKPPKSAQAARLLNDIVLAEESDDLGNGLILSHFELYLRAMDEIGADTNPILHLLQQLQHGQELHQALKHSALSQAAKKFTTHTFSLLREPDYVRAAVFYQSREEIIPLMFQSFLEQFRHEGIHCPHLELYLQRHIECDADEHGPAALELLHLLYNGSAERKSIAESKAQEAIQARIQLWDATQTSILRVQNLEASDGPPSRVQRKKSKIFSSRSAG